MAKAKVVDKWKMKDWYTVYAPDMFEGKEIAQVPAEGDAKLMNRIIRVTLSDITGDFSQTYTNLEFRIEKIQGKSAYTRLVGHYLSPSYMRSLVRRRRDVIHDVIDVQTRNQIPLRIKIAIFSAKKVSSPGKTAVRNAVRHEILARAKEMDFSTLEQEIVFGKFSSRIYKVAKRVVPIKRVEVRKTEVQEVFAA